MKDPLIELAVAFIARNYSEAMSETDLCRRLHMSRSTFSRRFKRVAGMTFRDYLLSLRLTQAKETLKASDQPVTDIAQAAGFYDLAQFDKLFRQRIGQKPLAYRAQSRHARGRRLQNA